MAKYPPMPDDDDLFARYGGILQVMADNPDLTLDEIRTVAALGLL